VWTRAGIGNVSAPSRFHDSARRLRNGCKTLRECRVSYVLLHSAPAHRASIM